MIETIDGLPDVYVDEDCDDSDILEIKNTMNYLIQQHGYTNDQTQLTLSVIALDELSPAELAELLDGSLADLVQSWHIMQYPMI